MEKRGDVRPGRTPDTEGKLTDEAVKKASAAERKEQTEKLDDDTRKRLADAAE